VTSLNVVAVFDNKVEFVTSDDLVATEIHSLVTTLYLEV